MNRLAVSLAAMSIVSSCLPFSASGQTLEETAWKGCQSFDRCNEKPKKSPTEVSGISNPGESLKALALGGGPMKVAMTVKDVPSPAATKAGGDSVLTRMGKGAVHGFNGVALVGPTWLLDVANDFEKKANRTNNRLSTGGYDLLFAVTCFAAGLAGIVGGVFGAVLGAPAGAISEAVFSGSTKDWEK